LPFILVSTEVCTQGPHACKSGYSVSHLICPFQDWWHGSRGKGLPSKHEAQSSNPCNCKENQNCLLLIANEVEYIWLDPIPCGCWVSPLPVLHP
jgi:hypothetical protein